MIQSGRDTKVFTGTMDQDTEARYLGPANYRYLLNGRTAINSQGTFGAVEDVMGNVLVPNLNLPNVGVNKVIGSYEDIAGQSCIYFVYNSNGFHGIYRWFANSPLSLNGSIETIYQVKQPAAYYDFYPNPLNFQSTKLITGINLVEDLLCWTDDYNEPKCINITRANNTNKQFVFELYLNDLSFQSDVNYVVDLYINAVFQASINWTSLASNSNNYKTRLIEAQTALSLNPNIFVENKETYLVITAATVGDYALFINDNSANQSQIIPQNFYPDFPSYPALNHQLFTRVKYPAVCNPNCSFVNFAQTQTFGVYNNNFTLGNGQWVNVGVGPPTAFYNYPANQVINFELTLTFSIAGWIPGTSSFQVEMTPYQIYDHPLNGGNGSFTLTWTWTYSDIFNNPQLSWFFIFTNCAAQVVGGTYKATDAATNTLLWYTGVVQSGILFSFGVPIAQWPGLDLQGGNLNVNLNRFSITEKTPLYRIKYIYVDKQHSVYSAYSQLTIPNNFVNNAYIEIDFSDKRLQNITTLCDIDKVIVAHSIDDGTTWFDIAELDRHEWVGQNKQFFYYDGNSINVTVDPAEALLQFHAVPLVSKAQEYVDQRIFDGNITEGYDKIKIDIFIKIIYVPLNGPDITQQRTLIPYVSKAYWKRGYNGKIGIVYYDDADRKTGVCTWIDNEVLIPTYMADQSQGFNPASIELTIRNTPPSWATKYQIVRTVDNFQLEYLIWNTNGYRYVDKYGNPTIQPNLYAYLILDLSQTNYVTQTVEVGAKISWTYVAGDRIKFICDENLTIFNDNDLLIVQVIGDEVWVRVQDIPVIFLPGVNDTLVFEVYSPNNKNEEDYDVYYEFGECYELGEVFINNNYQKYHKGNLQNQDLTTGAPAILELKNGNVYYRNIDFYYGVTQPAPPNIPQTFQAYFSSQQPYFANEQNFYGNGRTNSPFVEGRKTYNGIRFTDISVSNRNNINVNQPLNVEEYLQEYGKLNKLQVVNNDVLKLIFGNSYQLSVYISQGIIRQTQGAGNLISLSDQVAGNSRLIQRTLGTINSESVVVNDEGDMFGYDENEGVVWVSSGNGLIQISDRGMKSVFKQYSNERKSTLAISETPAIYDLYHDEYIITLNTIQNAPGATKNFPGYTIAYNKQKGGWTSYYSFIPDYYGRVRDYVVSFVKGQLYVHDRNSIAKEFYGTQYNRELTYVSNKDFPKVRDFKAISINGIGLNDVPSIRVIPFEGYPNGMFSLLTKRFFKVLEGVQYAYFQKDRLTPGMQANQVNAMANGRNLKGQVLEVTLVNDDTTKSSIYSSEIIYFYSEHS